MHLKGHGRAAERRSSFGKHAATSHSRGSRFFMSQPVLVYLGTWLQENVYQDERPFVSAKKVMWEMGEPYRSHVELLSFHTVSKVGGRCPCKGKAHCSTGRRPGPV